MVVVCGLDQASASGVTFSPLRQAVDERQRIRRGARSDGPAVEWFQDTRYDGWARTLYQVGPEVTVNEHFRYEIHLARQVDRLPEAETLDAVGFVAKWYF